MNIGDDDRDGDAPYSGEFTRVLRLRSLEAPEGLALAVVVDRCSLESANCGGDLGGVMGPRSWFNSSVFDFFAVDGDPGRGVAFGVGGEMLRLSNFWRISSAVPTRFERALM